MTEGLFDEAIVRARAKFVAMAATFSLGTFNDNFYKQSVLLLAVGAGMTWSTTRAVWQGLTTWGGVFKRTPKFRIEGRSGRWNANAYRLPSDWTVLGEIALFGQLEEFDDE